MLKTRYNSAGSGEELLSTIYTKAFPQEDTNIDLLVRTFVTDQERPDSEALNTADDLVPGYYLVEQGDPSPGGLGGRTFTRTYSVVPTLPDEPATYVIDSYIVSANAVGWNTSGFVPNGATQVAFEEVGPAAVKTTAALGSTITQTSVPNTQNITFTHPDGWASYVAVTNRNLWSSIEITVWGVTSGAEVPYVSPRNIAATIKRDFFLVGPEAWADYAASDNIPRFSTGDVYSGSLKALEESSLSRWRGNIYERRTLVSSSSLITSKFRVS